MTNPVHYLLVGLLFGSLFLTLGIFLGYWLAKSKADSQKFDSEKDRNLMASELQRVSDVVSSVAKWTSEFTADFSKYQTEMSELNEQAAHESFVLTRENVQKLLQQIVENNQTLRVRLDSAEKKLETQSQLLEGFLSEARTDSLTGLPNRRSFDQKIESYFNMWNQSERIFSLALIDIDHFKSVNDIHGHPVGDIVLREVSKKLSQITNERVHVSRYGGEEFAILLDEQLIDAASFAESLRQSFTTLLIPIEDQILKITLSIGVAQIMPNDRIGSLVRKSDEALYSAKLAGRNRVFVHDGNMCRVFGASEIASQAIEGRSQENETPDKLDKMQQPVHTHRDTPSHQPKVDEPAQAQSVADSQPLNSPLLEQRIRDRIEEILSSP